MGEKLSTDRMTRASQYCVVGLFVLAVIYTLHYARELLIPITLAVVFALLLNPLVELAVRWRMPRALASLLAVLALVGFAGGAGYALSRPAAQWIERLPEIRSKLRAHLTDVQDDIQDVGEATREIEALADEISEASGQKQNAEASVTVVAEPSQQGGLWAAAGRFVSTAMLSLMLLFFLLAAGEQLFRRIIERQPRLRDKQAVVELLNHAQQQMSRYLVTITAVNLLVGFCTAIGLWLLNIPNPALWGTVAAMLRYVPYLGVSVTVVLLLAVSAVTHETLAWTLAAPLGYLLFTSIVGQLIDPLIHGRRFTLNPIIVFVWIFFWGWLWGAAGVLLAVPLLTLLKVICEQHAPFRPLADLISSQARAQAQ